ncbi:SCA7, zinc-binding domain-containing protein [Parasitella parasitica]|nr:SCA7, zinc-binding domain-containing protein [Parasitella parasitica]
MTTMQRKAFSDEDDSDNMGTNKTQAKSTKKRKRSAVKRFDDEQHTSTTIATSETTATTAETTSATAIPNKDTSYLDDIEETEEKEKKKIKREKKSKPKAIPKKKAPLDLDRQCGVLIAPLMNPCTRSLTCKIHAMGAKRAVEGRTHPFNELLAAYQKKGIGRPQVPVGGNQANQHGQQKSSSSSKLNLQHQQQKQQQQQKTPNEDDDNSNIAIDSDEETENIRIAIEQTRPIPLGCRQVFYVRRKREYHKLRDILLEAITPKVSPTSAASTTTTTSTSPTSTSL